MCVFVYILQLYIIVHEECIQFSFYHSFVLVQLKTQDPDPRRQSLFLLLSFKSKADGTGKTEREKY